MLSAEHPACKTMKALSLYQKALTGEFRCPGFCGVGAVCRWGAVPCGATAPALTAWGSRLLEVVSHFSTTVEPHRVPDLSPAALRSLGHDDKTNDGLFIHLFKKNSGLLRPGPALAEQPLCQTRGRCGPIPWSQLRSLQPRELEPPPGSHTGRGGPLPVCLLISSLPCRP